MENANITSTEATMNDNTPEVETEIEIVLPGASASYSVEDNKLRLYARSRLSAELYARVKAAGFKWAPKQELFVAPAWSPAREDLLLELCGEIDDEDYSPEERAADRAERFSGYRDKRIGEAGGHADTFDSGPSAFGHQNRQRAERQASRHDRYRTRAVSQWSKAEYWQERTEGVIRNALYKSSAPVRRSRILRLEAEQRKHEKNRDEYAAEYKMWVKVPTLDGATVPGDRETPTAAYRLTYALANGRGWSEYPHPRSGKVTSLYSMLTDLEDPITPAEAAALWMKNAPEPTDPESGCARWSDHYANRLGYERAMLAQEGGTVTETDIEVGGWVKLSRRDTAMRQFQTVDGWAQVHKINRSNTTGRVVSVAVMGADAYMNDTKIKPRVVNIERAGEDCYRPPTDAEREAFKVATTEKKAKEKASKPTPIPLVNPTEADAQKLQDIWNEKAAVKYRKQHGSYGECPVSEVWRMTQEEYSQRSKGSNGSCETVTINEKCEIDSKYWNSTKSVEVFKIRKGSGGGFSMSAAYRVIVLTDKPQKSLPWASVEAARATMPTIESMMPKLDAIAAALGKNSTRDLSDDEMRLLSDAQYVRWAYHDSCSQFGWTDAGMELWRKRIAEQKQQAELVTVQ